MEDNGRELGAFLRSRRARIAPQSVGIANGRRRRVRGLRREELAQLAGISVDYYVRLEQGRATQPSAEVLDALATALGRGRVEHQHLVTLATRPRATGGTSPGDHAPGGVSRELRRVLDGMPELPAYVVDERLDVLAWNRLGAELLGAPAARGADRNCARYLFLDPASRALFPDWRQRATEQVAMLRHSRGRYPGDHRLTELIAELSERSEEFRRTWAAGDVMMCGTGTKRYRHPAAGELELTYTTLHVPPLDGRMGQQLHVFTAAEDSPTAHALRTWAGSPLVCAGDCA
ncbi:helix-turn-helix transcriptional regulator [Streptomyces specialis]|uniref:helix-turn-helix transcriptional regulator n=1 Tax=Streptomyces specialis TaxID=498367 RepID=UPI00073EC720|nr:helix-turn-helix transcriptional regulator [Streptomyces specialis]